MSRYDPNFELDLPPDLFDGSEPAAAIRAALSLPGLQRFQGARMALFVGAVILSRDADARDSAMLGLDRAREGFVRLQGVLSGEFANHDVHPEAMAILTDVVSGHPPIVEAMGIYRAEVEAAIRGLKSGAPPDPALYDGVVATAYGTFHPAMLDLTARMAEIGRDRRARAESAARAAQLRALEARERIADIARTVRLISLNARVEAARAGESGRAFGVIANEIRALSEQTETVSLEMRASVDEIMAHFRAV